MTYANPFQTNEMWVKELYRQVHREHFKHIEIVILISVGDTDDGSCELIGLDVITKNKATIHLRIIDTPLGFGNVVFFQEEDIKFIRFDPPAIIKIDTRLDANGYVGKPFRGGHFDSALCPLEKFWAVVDMVFRGIEIDGTTWNAKETQ